MGLGHLLATGKRCSPNAGSYPLPKNTRNNKLDQIKVLSLPSPWSNWLTRFSGDARKQIPVGQSILPLKREVLSSYLDQSLTAHPLTDLSSLHLKPSKAVVTILWGQDIPLANSIFI